MSSDFLKNNKFTYEQSVAVKNDYGNVLVSASAGSGKTKVLIGRIINLILDKKCSVKDLLVVTFTNAAADEMKARLKQELIKYNLLEELDSLNNADIFNLHKFCSKIIKEFFFVENLDNNLNVLAENEADYLLAECVEKCITHNINDTAFQSLLENYNKNRNFLEFKKTVFKIHKFLKSVEDSTLWVSSVLENSFNASENNKPLNFLNDYYVEKIKDAVEELKHLKVVALANDLEKVANNCVSLIEIGEKFIGKTFSQNFELVKLDYAFPTIYGKAKSEEEKDIRKNYSAIKKQLQEAVKDYSEACPYETQQELEIALKNNKEKITSLIDFVNFVDGEYSCVKKKINSLDFNDLEHYALKILANENILNEIKNRYKYIFVDEYQDTNSVQEKILSLISSGDNLFMVGDVKQSIYGFRFCNPQIFIDKYNKFESSLSDTNFLVNLNKNFRSETAVLDFCNFVFSRIMTKDTCGISYEDSSMFVSGKGESNQNITTPLINVAVFNDEKKESEIATGLYDIENENNSFSENNLDKQILYVAGKIKELLQEDIFDENLNSFRKIRYSDIAILSRNRSKTIERFSKILNELNIPVNASFKTKLFESKSVNLILNFLKVLENFYQDIPLYSLLNSFIFKLNEDDLVNIKLIGDKNETSNFFYNKVLSFYKSEDALNLNNQSILNKLSLFFDVYNKFLSIKETFSLQEIVHEIINTNKIEEYYRQTENLEELQNIKIFLDFVSTSGFNSVQELLFYIENFGADKAFDKTIVDSDNSVCLTTIHASKGLEYPIVFVVDMGAKFSNSTMHENLILDLDLGISTSYINLEERSQKDVPTTKGIKLKKKQFEVQEEMRLLYVALTRAKTKLYLVGEVNLEKIEELKSANNTLSKNSYYAWILGLLSYNQLETLKNNESLVVNYGSSKFKFTLERGCDEEEPEIKTLEPVCDFNTELIKNYLSFKLQKSEEKLRYTVTELLQENEDDSLNLNYAYSFQDKNSDIDYSLLGTVYHTVMQKIDFQNLSFMDCKKEIPKLIKEYSKNFENGEVVDEKQIENAVYNLGEFVNKTDKIYKEIGFHLYINSRELGVGSGENRVAVQGVVDLIIEKNNEVIILDYKTSRLKNENDFVKKYKNQLDLYAKAVSKFFKKPVSKKIIYSFYLNRLIFV